MKSILSLFEARKSPRAQVGSSPKVFISHSGDEGDVGAFLDQLVLLLSTAGFEPLIDRWSTTKGSDFHRSIRSWVDECDAAVFVISRRALEPGHSWVRDEYLMLSYRLGFTGFQAVPVFLESTKPDDLAHGWEALDLVRRDAIIGQDPLTAASNVVLGLAPTLASRSLGTIERTIVRALRSVDESVLRDATFAIWKRQVSAPVARHIAKILLEEKTTPAELQEFAETIVEESLQAASAVVRYVLPFKWVDEKAAGVLRSARQAGQFSVLRASQLHTAESYVIRGTVDFPIWNVRPHSLVQGEDLAEAVHDAERDAQWDAGDVEGTEKVEEQYVVYAIDCREVTPDVVSFYRSYCKDRQNIHVLFLGRGLTNDPDKRDEWAASIEVIRPELDLDVEKAVWFYRQQILTNLEMRDHARQNQELGK